MLLCLLFLSAGTQARTLTVGENQAFKTPSAAAAVAGDGDRIEIQPGSYFDCAVWTANHLAIEGIGDPDKVVIADKACQGKALFVMVGDGITVRNLTLTRARVPDGNGAGIRAEGRNLMVEHVRFVGNENGLMSGTAGGTIVIRDSLFDRNGTCLHACAHGVYVGQLDLLHIENTHFVGTRQGHHIKSRALRTEIVGCTIEDGPDGTASFEIELPNGGSLVARGNTMRKGPKSENHGTMISIGAEGVTHPTLEIVVEDNTAQSDGQWDTYFLRNTSATEAVLRGNRLSGALKALRGHGTVTPP
jgi:hypothetical protein